MMDMLFGGNAAWFGLPAVIGTIFFAVRLGLMLMGGDSGGVDADADVAIDADSGHPDSSDAMKVLSIQSIATFLMGFGWGGLAALNGFEQSWLVSLLCGVGVGIAMVWVLGILLKGVHDLQSSGNIRIGSAMGCEGTVYVRVPPRNEGRGQVRVVIDGRQRIFSAVTEGAELDRNTRVRVTRVNEDNTLTIAAA